MAPSALAVGVRSWIWSVVVFWPIGFVGQGLLLGTWGVRGIIRTTILVCLVALGPALSMALRARRG